MTKSHAIALQAKWKQQDPPRLCEHLKVESERNVDCDLKDHNHCTVYGQSVPAKPSQDIKP